MMKHSIAVNGYKNSSAKIAAIKIISDDLIQQHGKEEQLKRIEREKLIIDHSHPNLIQIYDGGTCIVDNKEYLFIAMEFLDQSNLKDANDSITLPMIPSIIKQLASVCCFLESIKIAHRDIKLENIVIDESLQTIKLLDLGVLRPILDESEYPRNTDFIATLRASPPELMERKEGASIEDWRAITFYQIGVVLYELLAKKPIFEKQSSPKPALILAVKSAYPSFDDVIHQDDNQAKSLMQLCKKCLRKDPAQRTAMLTWSAFENILDNTTQKDLSTKARLLKGISNQEDEALQLNFKIAQQTKEICQNLKNAIRALCQNDPSRCLSPLTISHNITSYDTFSLTIMLPEITKAATYEFKADATLGTLAAFIVEGTRKTFLYDDSIGADDLNNEIINSLLLHYIENMSTTKD